ncbi:type IV secretion system protein VirB10 [Variovorax sp. W1I1]|nr:TrbI/VirB10 family protein [Variovorax sp. W1I1]MDQ0608289.1 type IV secretion system protein VirB10 [Variovorax sp. W1I1]
MTWIDQTRRGARMDPPTPSDASDIDPGTGEILSARTEAATGGAASRDADERTTVRGERAIPSVNRERSVQSRISGFLALAVIVLLGSGFLFWYYNTQYAKTREAEEAARKAASARAGGEMKVPPLGRIDPPKTPPEPPPIAGTPPAPATTAVNAGTPQKTPEQIALERQLGTPVLRRAQSAQPSGNSTPHAFTDPAVLPAGGVPSMSQLLGALQPPGAASAASGGGQLGASLRPTPTPAVLAQTLPTRRMLLPKGAFIDCTLETAIDSTYEGMTTCIGASDIYGADGKVVLLERGTKYVGEQRGTPRQGQGRVFVVWNEARTPTGVVVQLASPGPTNWDAMGCPVSSIPTSGIASVPRS